MRIYDVSGREAWRRAVDLKPGRNLVRLGAYLRTGNYFVRVRFDGQTYRGKLTMAR